MFKDDEIRVVDENDQEVPYGELGIISSGPTTIRATIIHPNTKEGIHRKRFLSHGGCVRMVRGRYLAVEGRIKDTLTGGEKISAEEVRTIFGSPERENLLMWRCLILC